jgi:hypothetical protein
VGLDAVLLEAGSMPISCAVSDSTSRRVIVRVSPFGFDTRQMSTPSSDASTRMFGEFIQLSGL